MSETRVQVIEVTEEGTTRTSSSGSEAGCLVLGCLLPMIVAVCGGGYLVLLGLKWVYHFITGP